MDIEDLSKSQLLLLTILVNFVVSIATGVLTVSLLDAAPVTVTQTVNRIVDHTIETVTTQVPTIGTTNAPSSEDLLTSAIATAVSHTVTIQYKVGAQTITTNGLYLSSSRFVIGASSELPSHVTIVFPNGSTLEADKSGQDGSLVRYAFAAEASIPQVSTLALVQSATIKQGQTAIGLTPDGKAVTGIVSKIDGDGVHADLPGVNAGAPIFNLSGGVMGITAGGGLYLSADRIDALISTP